MDVEKIVKSACAISTIEFNKAVEAKAKRLTKEEDVVPVWALSMAIQSCLPDLLENTIKMVLNDVLEQLERKD